MKKKTFNSLGIPILLSNIINGMANFICFAVIYYYSKEGYVAFNTIIATLSIFFAFASMLFTGLSINLSKTYGGSGNIITDKIKRIISASLFFSIVIGFFIFAISNLLAEYLYSEAISSAAFIRYHRIFSLSIVAICIYSTIGIFMQSLGFASNYTRIIFIYSTLKIMLVLIISYKAISDIITGILISYVVLDFLLVIVLVFYLFGKSMLLFKINILSIDSLREIVDAVRFSIPICMGVTVQRYVFSTVLVIAASTNIDVASGFNAFINFFMLIIIPVISYGHALALLSGQAIGRGDTSESRKYLLVLIKYSVIYLIFILIPFYAISFTSVFTSELSVYSNKILPLFMIFVSYFGIQIIMPYYRSFGEVFIPQVINSLIPLSLLIFLKIFYLPEKGGKIDEASMLFIYMILGIVPLFFLMVFGFYKRDLFFGFETFRTNEQKSK